MAAAVDNSAATAGIRKQPPPNAFTLTSSNPFAEDDEHDQSSYAYVSSLLSKVRNTFALPTPKPQQAPGSAVPRSITETKPSIGERKVSLPVVSKNTAPPLVSVTPVVSEAPSMQRDIDSPISRTGLFSFATQDHNGEGPYGTAIPGFPIDMDARSIKTSTSLGHKKSTSVSKVIRRLRGEGLSRDYWMDDEHCK